MENDLITINYKCEHCSHEWSIKATRGVTLDKVIQCPSCKRFTENVSTGIKNFFTQMKK